MRSPRSLLCSKMLCYICVLHLSRQLAVNYMQLVSSLYVMVMKCVITSDAHEMRDNWSITYTQCGVAELEGTVQSR